MKRMHRFGRRGARILLLLAILLLLTASPVYAGGCYSQAACFVSKFLATLAVVGVVVALGMLASLLALDALGITLVDWTAIEVWGIGIDSFGDTWLASFAEENLGITQTVLEMIRIPEWVGTAFEAVDWATFFDDYGKATFGIDPLTGKTLSPDERLEALAGLSFAGAFKWFAGATQLAGMEANWLSDALEWVGRAGDLADAAKDLRDAYETYGQRLETLANQARDVQANYANFTAEQILTFVESVRSFDQNLSNALTSALSGSAPFDPVSAPPLSPTSPADSPPSSPVGAGPNPAGLTPGGSGAGWPDSWQALVDSGLLELFLRWLLSPPRSSPKPLPPAGPLVLKSTLPPRLRQLLWYDPSSPLRPAL